jgi:signal peptidase II
MILRGPALVCATLGIDQATKSWALNDLWQRSPDGVALAPFLNLRLGFNSGISFGLFAESAAEAPWLLVVFKVAVVVVLALWLWRTRNPIEAVSLGAIMGGALGNVADRIRYGAVVDFIDAHAVGLHWPTFNMADVFIVSGVTGLIWASLRTRPVGQRDVSKR